MLPHKLLILLNKINLSVSKFCFERFIMCCQLFSEAASIKPFSSWCFSGISWKEWIISCCLIFCLSCSCANYAERINWPSCSQCWSGIWQSDQPQGNWRGQRFAFYSFHLLDRSFLDWKLYLVSFFMPGHVFKSLNTSGLIPKQGKSFADRIDGIW